MRPKTIKVLNAVYTIDYHDTLELNDEPAYGICDYDKKIISIATGCHELIMRETILHELIHAIDLEYHIDTADDEHVADCYAAAFIKTFADNKGLADYLGIK